MPVHRGSALRRWLPAFASGAVLLLSSTYQLYVHELRRSTDERYELLSSIAEIKADQVAHWRHTQLEAVERMARRPLFCDALQEWQATRYGARERAAWNARLGYERRPEVAEAFLFAPDGHTLLASTDPALDIPEPTLRVAAMALESSAPALSEPFRAAQSARMVLDVAAVVLDENHAPLAILVFRIDPHVYLFPLIQLWPTRSATAETMLVRQDGRDVVFLTPLRHGDHPEPGFRLPLSAGDGPAAQAVRGGNHRLAGRDYRGVEVLAEVRRLPESTWCLVAQIDRAEIDAMARSRTLFIAGFVALILSATAVAGAFVHHRRQTAFFRKLYLAEHRQSEEREQFRTILYSIGDAVITTDERARIEVMNAVATRLTGWSEIEARGRALEEVFVIVDPASYKPVAGSVAQVLAGTSVEKIQSTRLLVARDGGRRPIAESASPIRDPQGRTVGAILVFRDRSEEQAADQALRDSEARFRQLADALPHLVWTATAEGRVDFYNDRHREYAGIHQTESGFEWEPVVHPDEREATIAAWTRARETGQPYEMEHRIRTASGEFRWVLSRGLPVRNSAGEVVKWFGTATDIDDLKSAQRAAAASEARFRALFENMTEAFAVGVPIRDETGRAVSFRLIQVNRAFERETGLPATVVDRSILDVAPLVELVWIQTFAEVAATGRPISLTEFNRDTARHYEVFCFRPAEGRFSLLFRNVTERVRADAELKRTLTELKRSNTDLEQFAFAASHDLKSPLRAIESLAQWLDEDLRERLDGEHLEHLRLLRQRARRMARLLDDLLAYARAGHAGRAERVDVAEMLAQVRDFLAPPPGIEIRLELPLPVLTTPVAPLRQVFTNLLGNAIKHHDRPTGIVTVSARQLDGHVQFTVQDDGPGVPLEFRKRVFEMFQTLRPRDEVDGSGMGLAIVRRTVESVGGSVELTAAQTGRGTVVRFRWPLVLQNPEIPSHR